jgi:hypothetical protein
MGQKALCYSRCYSSLVFLISRRYVLVITPSLDRFWKGLAMDVDIVLRPLTDHAAFELEAVQRLCDATLALVAQLQGYRELTHAEITQAQRLIAEARGTLARAWTTAQA